MPKISVFAKLTARPGQRDEMVAAFTRIQPLLDAEEGTELYTVHLDESDENVLWTFELYRDQAAFDAHGSGEALASLFVDLGSLVGAPPELHQAVPVPGKGIAV